MQWAQSTIAKMALTMATFVIAAALVSVEVRAAGQPSDGSEIAAAEIENLPAGAGGRSAHTD